MLNTENLEEYFNDANNNNNKNNARKFTNFKLNNNNSNNASNNNINNSREQHLRDSINGYEQQNTERLAEKLEPYLNNSNSKQITPAFSNNSNNNSFKNPSPPQKKLANNFANGLVTSQEEKFNNNNNNNFNNNTKIINGNTRKPYDTIIAGSFEKESFATASDSVSLNSADDHNNLEIQNKSYRPNNLNGNNSFNANNNIVNSQSLNNLNTNKPSKILLKIDENPKKNLQFQLDDKSKEKEQLDKEAKFKAKEKPMKSRNNQSTFAKNPSQSYAEPYYASFPPNDRPPKVPLSYFGFSQYSPREIMYPYVVPSNYGPLAPYIPAAAFPYQSPTGVLSYNLLLRPLILDDKNPSLHDLLYYDTFKNKDVPYATRHIEKKIRAVDGFYNPYGRYTLQDYRQLKANEAFASPNNDLDSETKDDKAEKMHKRQEIGNMFMKSNPKPPRKPINVQPDPDAPMPQPQRKQVNLQEPFDLKNMGRKRQEPISNENDNDDDLDYNGQEYFDMHRMNNYLPSFFNNSNNTNGFVNRSMNMKNSKQDWDDEILDENLQSQTFSDSKLTQSQSLKPIQINHPTKKFYKNPKFNFNEKPVEVPVVEARQRAIDYAKRIKD